MHLTILELSQLRKKRKFAFTHGKIVYNEIVNFFLIAPTLVYHVVGTVTVAVVCAVCITRDDEVTVYTITLVRVSLLLVPLQDR